MFVQYRFAVMAVQPPIKRDVSSSTLEFVGRSIQRSSDHSSMDGGEMGSTSELAERNASTLRRLLFRHVTYPIENLL
jgi:hypothetical protein